MKQPRLSVVIPAYNERERLRQAIPSIAAYLQSMNWPFEIIVVNDGSSDDTAGVTETLAKAYSMVRLITLNPNRGKGAAVRAGMLGATGRYVLFTDADQSTPISEVDKLLDKLERDNYDVAIGSRAVPGANVRSVQPWYSTVSKRLFRFAMRILVLNGIADTQCGFKCMKREVARAVFPQVTSNTSLFDIEMLTVATREGYRVAEVPIKWVDNPDSRLPYNPRRLVGVWVELFRIKQIHGLGRPLRVKK